MKNLIENGRLAWRLVNDPRVPAWVKVGIPLLVAVYLLSPIDLIPDFLIGPGELDDLGVVLLGLSLMVRFAPQHVVEEHRRAMGYQSDGAQATGAPRGRSYWEAPGSGTAGRAQEPAQTDQDPPIDGEYRVIAPDSDRPYAN